MSWSRPLLQRVGWGISVFAIGGKWRRGMEGAEGEAVIEEVGTWWRTFGPELDCQLSSGRLWRGVLGPSLTSKMARKIALSMIGGKV